MVKVNKITPQTVEHFDPNGNTLGFLNEYESNDVRVQVAQQQLRGYYLMFNNIKIPIQPNGKILNWEAGLYDTIETQLSKIFIRPV